MAPFFAVMSDPMTAARAAVSKLEIIRSPVDVVSEEAEEYAALATRVMRGSKSFP